MERQLENARGRTRQRLLALVWGDHRGVQARAALDRALVFTGNDERTALETLERALDLELSVRHRELSEALAAAKA